MTSREEFEKWYRSRYGEQELMRSYDWAAWQAANAAARAAEQTAADAYVAEQKVTQQLQRELEQNARDILRLIEAIKYLRGIAVRGEGREAREDETVEQFVLGYVKRIEAELEQARRDALRYRWMKANVKRIPPGWDLIGWDAAIDAAMEQGK